jgi:hypothetical protein
MALHRGRFARTRRGPAEGLRICPFPPELKTLRVLLATFKVFDLAVVPNGNRSPQIRVNGSLCSLGTGSGLIVIAISILVALAALSGFLLGQRRVRWFVMLAVGAVLATLAALALQKMGLEAAIGIPVIVACLTLYQGAYVLGLLAGNGDGDRRSGSSPEQQTNKSPSDDRDNDVRHEREWQ